MNSNPLHITNKSTFEPYPITCFPILKSRIWGGEKLKTLGKNLPNKSIGESWELSMIGEDISVVKNGVYQYTSIDVLINNFPKQILGEEIFEKFGPQLPLLFKFLDAKTDLSIQLHPNDVLAKERHNSYGKTEMWYIIDCDQDSSLLYGFNNNITKEEFRQRIENNTLLEVTKSVPVKKGDTFFIKAGTLHAIGKGILIAEIQQNSNTTYRIYDYDRKDKNGKSRELHIDKACEVTNLCAAENYPQSQALNHNGFSQKLLSSCEYFNVNLLNISSHADISAKKESFEHLLVISGSAALTGNNCDKMDLNKGDSIFIPAGAGEFTISGKCEIIKTNIVK